MLAVVDKLVDFYIINMVGETYSGMKIDTKLYPAEPFAYN